VRTWLFDHFRRVSRAHGFEEVDFPVLEHESLYTRKAGEEITRQLYNFSDKSGRRVCLRPELTPSLVRLVLQKGKSIQVPTKWFAVGQCWRYERTTRGRRREHYQWNMDIVGVPGVEAEAELIHAVVAFFKAVGLTHKDVCIKVSNRKLLQAVLIQLGVPEALHAAVFVCIDKLGKVDGVALEEELVGLGVDHTAAAHVLGLASSGDLAKYREVLLDGATGHPALDEVERLLELVAYGGLGEWVSFDGSIVRGLAYYSGTVFECFDRAGKLRAICGGGRYDHLLSTFGHGGDLPMVGFGFGDAVILELLQDKGLLPPLQQNIDDVVVALDPELQKHVGQVAAALREKGRVVDAVLDKRKMKWVFKHAQRCHAKRLVILGEDEWRRGKLKVKDLDTREEQEVDASGLEGL